MAQPITRMLDDLPRGAIQVASLAIAMLCAAGSAPSALAQVTEPPRGFVGPDLGPASRPTGVPPNSGLVTGTQARPPGDPAAIVVPDHLRRPEPPRVERYEHAPLPERAGRSARRRPPALPRASHRRCPPGLPRCR